eukprot:TRINITY_DN4244_c0_g1_i1.p1 TRINITY_DN4244_c0_g1~~TRINITY_DN4244_c0_g1_i1.p1  ORF type:complete len:394 (+),score=75.43 TRINITY_DN4244_c0_g1_i1:148-1182(+)
MDAREKEELEKQELRKKASERKKEEEEDKNKAADKVEEDLGSQMASALTISPTATVEPPPVVSHPPINYSEFEAASDPFESAELQTINDLQELAACFPSLPPSSNNFPYYPPTVQPPHQRQEPSSLYNYEKRSPNSANNCSGHNLADEGLIKNEENPMGPRSVASKIASIGNLPLPQDANSCSGHDPAIMGHKESENNPRASKTSSQLKGGLENWTPWPNLDNLQGSSEPFSDLSDSDKAFCQGLSEIGFPSSRLSKGVKALGQNSEQMINFCLIVDELSSKTFEVECLEDIVLLTEVKEKEAQETLDLFIEVKELGFPSSDILTALRKAGTSKDDVLKFLLKD